MGETPRIRLLPDFVRRMFQAAIESILFRQIQQGAQRISQSYSSTRRDCSLLQRMLIEKVSKEKEIVVGRKRYRFRHPRFVHADGQTAHC